MVIFRLLPINGKSQGPALWSILSGMASEATTGWVQETKEISIMKNALDTIKAWAWGFIDLMLIFIAVGVLASVVWNGNENFFTGMVGRLTALIGEFSSGGFVGLIALVIVLSLFNRRTA